MFTPVTLIKSFYNDTKWEEKLTNETRELNSTSTKQLARELLEANLTKCASLLIEKLITSGERWVRIKHVIFGSLEQETDIRLYDRYLSYQWNKHTSDLITNALHLDKHLNVRASHSLLNKLKTKLSTENYLLRNSESISKIFNYSRAFFATLNVDFAPTCTQMENSLTDLITFYSRISPEDICALSSNKSKEQQKLNETDKKIIKQQEFLRAALNYEIRCVSEQSLVDIFGKEEAPQQIKKFLTLGVVVFDMNDAKARKNAAKDYATEQMKKFYCEDPFA